MDAMERLQREYLDEVEAIARSKWEAGYCPKCRMKMLVRRGDRLLCLTCGSVYTHEGRVLGRIKSWDHVDVYDLEPVGV